MKISIIIPYLNESLYIQDCLHSLVKQIKNTNEVEFILVDGGSLDDSTSLAENVLKDSSIAYKFLHNPKRWQSISMNIGYKASEGNVIVRCDAHCIYPGNFIEIIYNEIVQGDKEYLSFNLKNSGKGYIQKIIAAVMSSTAGMGVNPHRTCNRGSCNIHGAFSAVKREVIEKHGYYQNIEVSEDYEFARRLIDSGVKHYRYPLQITYYVRPQIGAFIKQMFRYGYGKWNYFITYKKKIETRNMIPVIFTLYILILSLFSYVVIIYVPLLFYLIFLISGAVVNNKEKRQAGYYIFFIFLTFLAHLFYGLGAINRILKNEFSNNFF